MGFFSRMHVLRALVLLALAVSLALLAGSFGPDHRLCPIGGGCDQVTHSWFGRPFGMPLPLVGALVFGAMFILSLVPTSRVGRLLLPVALLAGAGGAVLIALQLF